ncbi:hypothetical protein R5R35_011935 [Gryllus longicercus]|uniref:Uncharacterized protein n=1 Tax=Gryllus longicercus TaxID=2509291 RepID=A0AAN9V2S4_9ORTH
MRSFSISWGCATVQRNHEPPLPESTIHRQGAQWGEARPGVAAWSAAPEQSRRSSLAGDGGGLMSGEWRTYAVAEFLAISERTRAQPAALTRINSMRQLLVNRTRNL